MGRRTAGDTPRDNFVGIRLNQAETTEMHDKMGARGLSDRAAYFRTLMHEDEGPR